ncbi:MAG: cytochrome b/b6 domain-containing protein [Proteobacteria bacterium]|nr:cytochrome b/b6 domain-containing protein [Pseudomonadota bacterium]MBU1710759.1 cytochrome b/b6 domain-containing protein [Pseudomonadota bacterium]
MKSTGQLIYIHPGPVRVWHWINAIGIILLILTGLQIRFAEIMHFFTLEEAIKVHNYIGFIVIGNFGLWIAYYFGTGKIKIYFPDIRSVIPNTMKQIKYYSLDMFKGEPNPHEMTPENKFNPLQQQAYLALMFILLPAQMVTGVLLWRVKEFEKYINMLGGIKIVDTIHVLLFFFFATFVFVHSYLATLGHTPSAHFKAMFTGYEEQH